MSDGSYSSKRRSSPQSTGSKPSVPAVLNGVAPAAQLTFISSEQFEVADTMSLLQLASAGGYGIMYGFNRTGGCNAMLFVGGEKPRAFLESGTGLANWTAGAIEYLGATFAVERPKAYEAYVKTTSGVYVPEKAV